MIGLGIGIGSALLLLVFQESVKHVIERFWQDASKTQIKAAFFVIVVVALVFPSSFSMIDRSPERPDRDISSSASQTEAEKVADVVDQGVEVLKNGKELVGDLAAEKRRKDSIRIANRPKYWGVQIGNVLANKRQAKQVYSDLPNKDHVFLLDAGREWVLFWKDGRKSKSELEAGLDAIREQLGGITSTLKVLDLNSMCPAKEHAVRDNDIKYHREDLEIPCMVCG